MLMFGLVHVHGTIILSNVGFLNVKFTITYEGV